MQFHALSRNIRPLSRTVSEIWHFKVGQLHVTFLYITLFFSLKMSLYNTDGRGLWGMVVDGVGLGLGLGLSETGLGLFQLGLGLFYIWLGLFHLGLFS